MAAEVGGHLQAHEAGFGEGPHGMRGPARLGVDRGGVRRDVGGHGFRGTLLQVADAGGKLVVHGAGRMSRASLPAAAPTVL